jgi:hypothetical protein
MWDPLDLEREKGSPPNWLGVQSRTEKWMSS